MEYVGTYHATIAPQEHIQIRECQFLLDTRTQHLYTEETDVSYYLVFGP